MQDKLAALLESRRFWAAVIALSIIVLQDGIGLSEEVSGHIAAVLSVWILGDSLQKTRREK